MSVVARTVGVTGGELVLRRDGDDWEVIANGVFLMDTRDGRSERLLVTAALERVRTGAAARGEVHVALAGLGLGTSLVAALADPAVGRVTVLEHEPALVTWHREHLSSVTGPALTDPRVELVVTDAADWLRGAAAARSAVDVVCLDVDNGPDWLVAEANAWLYEDAGVETCVRVLRAGGVLAHWAAAPSETLATTMARHLTDVETLTVDVERGAPDAVLLGRRGTPLHSGVASDA